MFKAKLVWRRASCLATGAQFPVAELQLPAPSCPDQATLAHRRSFSAYWATRDNEQTVLDGKSGIKWQCFGQVFCHIYLP